MPSRRKPKTSAEPRKKKQPAAPQVNHFGFYPVVLLVLFLWFIYRSVFQFPVWFDEIIGKALFMGLPVWIYVSVMGFRQIVDSFDFSKFKVGLLRGLAIGGIFGFVLSLFAIYKKGGVTSAAFYAAEGFWWEFFLALMTSFWETLFFYSFIMSVIQDKHKKWPLANQVLLVAVIFFIFHVPNSILRFTGVGVIYQLMLMFIFGIGQAFLFAREKNGYTLLLSQAIWGMVLLVQLS